MKAILDYYGFVKEIQIPEVSPRIYIPDPKIEMLAVYQSREDFPLRVAAIKKMVFCYSGTKERRYGLSKRKKETVAYYKYQEELDNG